MVLAVRDSAAAARFSDPRERCVRQYPTASQGWEDGPMFAAIEVCRVRAPGIGRLAFDPDLCQRWPGKLFGRVRGSEDLTVYDLDEGFDGTPRPVAVFPRPWPDFDDEASAVSPDLRFAVFGGRDRVRAVDRRGTTLWEVPYKLSRWGPEQGSCAVTADAARVWAHVYGLPGSHPEGGDQTSWMVIDAATGRLLAYWLTDCSERGSVHRLHPDGEHVTIELGGEASVYGRFTGSGVEVVDLPQREGLDLLVSLSPNGEHYVALDEFGGMRRETFPPGEPGPLLELGEAETIELLPGFVDDDRVLVPLVDYEANRAEHVLVSASDLSRLGPVRYPFGDVSEDLIVNALGDGTWLTGARRDDDADELFRWRLADGRVRRP